MVCKNLPRIDGEFLLTLLFVLQHSSLLWVSQKKITNSVANTDKPTIIHIIDSGIKIMADWTN